MHRGVITCRPDLPVVAVARIMAAHRIHCVVVEGSPIGVVTDADLTPALCEGTMASRTAREIARAAATVAPSETLARAGELMVEFNTTHVIVVDEHSNRPVGVVSVLDLAETLIDAAP
jgi:CBS domain-containing protein